MVTRSRKPRRRTRSPHPGIVLLRPDEAGRHPSWRARYRDPDTGKVVKVTLDPNALRSQEARRDWCVRKSKAIAKRRADLDAGAPKATGTALSDAVATYYRDHPQLRAATLELYRSASNNLLGWASRMGLRSGDDLTRASLVAYRAQVLKAPKRMPAPGVDQGARLPVAEPRSPHTINRELRSITTILNYLRKLGLAARITSDDLHDGLEKLRTGSERIDYRTPKQLQKLLDAASRHDAAVFDATREEHAKGEAGATLRYEPIAPFVAVVLLTGARFSEVLGLDWKQVDLEALDNEGNVVGEIHLAGSETKTHKARTVGLDVSPALRKLLGAMHLRSGGKGRVFGLSEGTAEAAQHRLEREFGAPPGCNWQALRRTCGVFLTNSPSIFGAASAYRSARQLGHSVVIAERHYVDVLRGISRDAKTLEAAMQIEAQLTKVTDAIGVRPATAKQQKAGRS